MQQINLGIAGMVVEMDCPHRPLACWMLDRYREFLRPGAPPDVRVNLVVEPGAHFLEPEPGPWTVRTARKGSRLTFVSYFEKGWVELQSGTAELILSRRGLPENFLRVIFAHLAVARDCLLVHAAGVVREGRSYVFFGPSGSGKTTSVRLTPGGTILSDDMVLLCWNGNRVEVQGVPFRGDLPETPWNNISAPAAAFFTLRKAPEHDLRPLSPALAAAGLIRCLPFVFDDPEAAPRVMELVEKMLRHTPVLQLAFRKDPCFWQLIDHRLGS